MNLYQLFDRCFVFKHKTGSFFGMKNKGWEKICQTAERRGQGHWAERKLRSFFYNIHFGAPEHVMSYKIIISLLRLVSSQQECWLAEKKLCDTLQHKQP